MSRIGHLGFASALAVAGLLAAQPASATLVWVSLGPVTGEPDTCTVNFDGDTCEGVHYSDQDENSVVTGDEVGSHAQPEGSTGYYLTVGPTAGTPLTITLEDPANYFGFLAGSLDTYNSIIFHLVGGGTLEFTGSDLAALGNIPADGDWDRSIFWNLLLDAGTFFDSITLTSSLNAFETDNHAFGVVSVPEPGTLGLLGLGLVGMGFLRRRKA